MLGRDIPIEFLPIGKVENGAAHASFCPDTMLIRVEDSPRWREFLFHEIMHAILEISGLAEILGNDIEEAVCSTFGHAMSEMSWGHE